MGLYSEGLVIGIFFAFRVLGAHIRRGLYNYGEPYFRNFTALQRKLWNKISERECNVNPLVNPYTRTEPKPGLISLNLLWLLILHICSAPYSPIVELDDDDDDDDDDGDDV